MKLLHGTKGIHGIGSSSPADFPIRNFCPGLAPQALSNHGQSGPISSYGTDLFQGGFRTRQENDLPQPVLLKGSSGNQEMAEVKRIKGSAKKTDPQGQKMLRSTWILSLGSSRMSRLGSTWISLALNSRVTPPWVSLTLRRLAKSVKPPQAATAPKAVRSLV